MARFYISAAHKSSGKTTLAIGLAATFAKSGVRVQTFKKGPDYIDPMWLARASGRPCFNLDFHTQSHDEIRGSLARRALDADVVIIEGNKGLYDGLDVEGTDSNAALANLLETPVVLVIDAEGMTRGVAPLVQGYLAFDDSVSIAGVILNRVGGARHEAKLIAALERYTGVTVFGALGRDATLDVPERHLGLTTPGETQALDEKIATIAASVAEGVDVQALRQAVSAAPSIGPMPTPGKAAVADVAIGIPRDAAFGFYYPDDLEALEAAGAELVFFDALRDRALPKVDGLFLGGGFPETQMAALEANASLRADIKAALEAGMPAYAECGGLMYLCRRLVWGDEARDMVGVVPGDAVMHPRPQGRGFVRLREREGFPWQAGGGSHGGEVAAHEFHYAALENLPGDPVFAYDVLRGAGVDGEHDGVLIGNLLASFCHLRDTDAGRWAARFVAFVRANKASGRADDAKAEIAARGPATTSKFGSN